LRRPVLLDQQHLVSIPAPAVGRPIHARRTDRHAWHGQTQGLGLFLQKALDVGNGHMAFDDIALHQRGMAGRKLLCHPQPGACRVVALVGHAGAKAALFHVRDPVLAAAAVGILPDPHGNRLGGCKGRHGGSAQGQHAQQEHAARGP